MNTRVAPLLLLVLISSCAGYERARVAAHAKSAMIGMSKEKLFACIRGPSGGPSTPLGRGGIPVLNAGASTPAGGAAPASGEMEVYFFPSGGDTTAPGSLFNSSRYCYVKVVLTSGRVSDVSYSGSTGGWARRDEQCAFAVQKCVP